MLVLTRKKTPRQQPKGQTAVNWGNPLTKCLTQLYLPSSQTELVTGQPIRTTNTNGKVLTAARRTLYASDAGGVNPQIYMPQNTGLVNSQLPWTIAVLMAVDSSVSGVSNYICSTTQTPGDVTSDSHDRSLGVSFSSPNLFLTGTVYDGSEKVVTHDVGIPFSSLNVFTAVISCSNGFLRCFLRGIKGASDTAVSNNGYSGYSATYFNVGTGAGTVGYRFGLGARYDGVGWMEAEARAFEENPFQLMIGPQSQIFVETAAAATTLVNIFSGRGGGAAQPVA